MIHDQLVEHARTLINFERSISQPDWLAMAIHETPNSPPFNPNKRATSPSETNTIPTHVLDAASRVYSDIADAAGPFNESFYHEVLTTGFNDVQRRQESFRAVHQITTKSNLLRLLNLESLPVYQPDWALGYYSGLLDIPDLTRQERVKLCAKVGERIPIGPAQNADSPLHPFFILEVKIDGKPQLRGNNQSRSTMMVSASGVDKMIRMVRDDLGNDVILEAFQWLDDPEATMNDLGYIYGLVAVGKRWTYTVMQLVYSANRRIFVTHEFWTGDLSIREQSYEAMFIYYRIIRIAHTYHKKISTWIRLASLCVNAPTLLMTTRKAQGSSRGGTGTGTAGDDHGDDSEDNEPEDQGSGPSKSTRSRSIVTAPPFLNESNIAHQYRQTSMSFSEKHLDNLWRILRWRNQVVIEHPQHPQHPTGPVEMDVDRVSNDLNGDVESVVNIALDSSRSHSAVHTVTKPTEQLANRDPSDVSQSALPRLQPHTQPAPALNLVSPVCSTSLNDVGKSPQSHVKVYVGDGSDNSDSSGIFPVDGQGRPTLASTCPSTGARYAVHDKPQISTTIRRMTRQT